MFIESCDIVTMCCDYTQKLAEVNSLKIFNYIVCAFADGKYINNTNNGNLSHYYKLNVYQVSC